MTGVAESARAGAQRVSTPFAVIIGLVVGVLATGLVVPYVRDAPQTQEVAATSPLQPSRSAGTDASQGETSDATGENGLDGGADAAGPDSPSADVGSTPAAGGGGQAADPDAGAVPDDAPAAGGVPGTDAGVSDSQVKIGFALLDIGIAKDFGMNFDIGNQKARMDALVADQNAKGGINGREIVVDYRPFNAAKPVETQQAACVGWTQDSKVFSVLVHSQLTQAAAVCIMGEGGTPVFTTDGIDESYYANGMLFTMQASDNRILRDHAAYLHEKGLLDGKTIGVLSGEGAERLAVDNTLVPELAKYGYNVAAVEVVPGDTTGTQRIPIAVSNLKAANVDFVIVAANVVLGGPFIQSADRSGFRPQFSLSDFNNQINDQVAANYPNSFDGTVGLSTHRFPEYRAGLPQPAADKACLDRVGKADPKAVDPKGAAWEVAMGECAIFDAWVAAATGAGENLNRPNLIAAAESLDSFPIPGTLDGSFGPGKHDAVDFEREVVWRKDCKCWKINGDPNALRRIG